MLCHSCTLFVDVLTNASIITPYNRVAYRYHYRQNRECLASSSVPTTGNQRRPLPHVFPIASESISSHDIFLLLSKYL